MCKHCEKIKEDVESRPIVHAFMADLAAKMTRNYAGSGVVISADDLDIKIEFGNKDLERELIRHKLQNPSAPGTLEREAGLLPARNVNQVIRMIDGAFGGARS